jgi:hypothetical protein
VVMKANREAPDHSTLPLRPKYLPQHSILENTQSMFFPECERPSFIPTKNNRQNCRYAYFSHYAFIDKMGRQKILGQMVACVPPV